MVRLLHIGLGCGLGLEGLGFRFNIFAAKKGSDGMLAWELEDEASNA